MVKLSHLYVTSRKTIALTIQTFVCKVMSLLFNVLINSLLSITLSSTYDIDMLHFHFLSVENI